MCVKLLPGDLNPDSYPAHPINTFTCEVWGVRVRVQVSRREFHTHIHLDYVRV